jgi:hypothetical protein
MFALLILSRCAQIIHNIIKMHEGKSGNSDKYKSSSKKLTGVMHFLLDLTANGFVIWMYFANDKLNDQNLVAKLWIHAEILFFILGIPYTLMIAEQIGVLNHFVGDIQALNAEIVMRTFIEHSEVLTPEQKALFDIRKEKLEEELLNHKKTLEFEEDFTMMTVLSYLKENEQRWLLKPIKQSQMLFSAVFVQLVVIIMLCCMLFAIFTDEAGEYTPNIAHSYAVWIVKFPCAIALHFYLYPEVSNGMNVMKFAN